MEPSIEFKMIDSRIIKFTVEKDFILCECGPFKAKYKHDKINHMIEMHVKILTSAQLKKLREFININREPEQLSLF